MKPYACPECSFLAPPQTVYHDADGPLLDRRDCAFAATVRASLSEGPMGPLADAIYQGGVNYKADHLPEPEAKRCDLCPHGPHEGPCKAQYVPMDGNPSYYCACKGYRP